MDHLTTIKVGTADAQTDSRKPSGTPTTTPLRLTADGTLTLVSSHEAVSVTIDVVGTLRHLGNRAYEASEVSASVHLYLIALTYLLGDQWELKP